ncbi:hypothetical protein GCM10017744_071020 [Streptomyces antimycoticus]
MCWVKKGSYGGCGFGCTECSTDQVLRSSSASAVSSSITAGRMISSGRWDAWGRPEGRGKPDP